VKPRSGAAIYLKHWLSREEYAGLDELTRGRYVLDGDEYRLKPDPKELREQKMALSVLAALALTFGLLGAYAIATDRWTLEILAFCGAMPTLLGLLVQLAMYFSWS
jgi:hypothetical protein